MGLGDELEFVNFPVEDGAFKVIQLYTGKAPVMVFGNVRTPHFVILREFLESKGIEFATIHNPSDRIPSVGGDGQPYRVAGAGSNFMYPQNKRFTLPEYGSTFHGDANSEHSAIFERKMLKDGWTRLQR